MVLDADSARIHPVIVSAEEIAIKIPGEKGHAGGVVLPPADVHSARVIHSHKYFMRDGPVGELHLGVEHGKLRVRREDHLVVLVHVHRGVREIQKRLHNRRPVQQLGCHLQIRLARVKREPHQPLHLCLQVHIAYPDGAAAIGILHQPMLHRKVAGRAMMAWDVPFHAAGNPGPDHADQSRLDRSLPVDVVIAICLVRRRENAPAQLGKNGNLHVLVFEKVRLVGLVALNVENPVIKRIRINLARSALVDSPRKEHGGLLRGANLIRWQRHRRFPDVHRRLRLRPEHGGRYQKKCDQ